MTRSDYHTNNEDEQFTYDIAGNRLTLNNRAGNDIVYSVDELNNQYLAVGGSSVSYDDTGNLAEDHNGYQYGYDYENRLTLVQDDEDATVAEFTYDALGRRIEKIDHAAHFCFIISSQKRQRSI